MRNNNQRRIVFFSSIVFLLLFFIIQDCFAGNTRRVYHVGPDANLISTGLGSIAAGTDSVFCGDKLFKRNIDYTINYNTGKLRLVKTPDCDSISVSVFQLPDWFYTPLSNKAPEGKKFIRLTIDKINLPDYQSTPTKYQKINLSGNKSFAFNVGRSGQGRFSQGLSIDFDARLSGDLNIRGSISDKSGVNNSYSGTGGTTTILSELDKYFFEIESKRVFARAGDIQSIPNRFLQNKRIKGLSGKYTGASYEISSSVGRPAGKYLLVKITGIDGKQGPYQISGRNGLAIAIVPGSEKVYLDGRLIEGGSDKNFHLDYLSGRITFLQGILITSRSRIEIDFEAADNDYEQVVYEAAQSINLFDDRLKIHSGGRKESDEKDRMRFGSLSPADISILAQSGDSSGSAYRTGIVNDTAGDYQLQVDADGNQYYHYVGSGAGDYSVAFSFVGDGQGDYTYLGNQVYQYSGTANGAYLPIIYLPLPGSNEYFYTSLEFNPYSSSGFSVEYQGNSRDDNLFSDKDDKDNFRNLVLAAFNYNGPSINSALSFRYRQAGYNPRFRVYQPDNERIWAIPESLSEDDEMRFNAAAGYRDKDITITAGGGYLNYNDRLTSYRMNFSGRANTKFRIDPRFEYELGNAKSSNNQTDNGLYERYSGDILINAAPQLKFNAGYRQELSKDLFGAIPDVEKFSEYSGSLIYRNSSISLSRRIDFIGDNYGRKGPQMDRLSLKSEEHIGRLKLSLTSLFLNQKQLDSFRGDRTERLFSIAIRYTAPRGWLSCQSDYRQNAETGRSSAYRYLQVNSGEGRYRYEDGQYLFDANGDYIRVREELGDAIAISRGEKSHNVSFYPGRIIKSGKFRKWLNQIVFRLKTEINEEIVGDGKRRISWVLPWVSHSGINYLTRTRREQYGIYLFPSLNFYMLNFSFVNQFEERDSGMLLFRNRKSRIIEIKNGVTRTLQTVLKGNYSRLKQTGISSINHDFNNMEYSASIIYSLSQLQISPKIKYLRLKDELSGGKGYGLSAEVEAIARNMGQGEIRLRAKFGSLTEQIDFPQPEYLVTDGLRFGKSAEVDFSANYRIGKSLRVIVNLTDRFFETSRSEFVGRGELVAIF